jgi:hypothetical protein
VSRVSGLPTALILIAAVTWSTVLLLIVTMAGVLLTTHLVRTRLFGAKNGKNEQKQAQGRTWSSVKTDAVASAQRRKPTASAAKRQPSAGRKKAKKR